MNTHWVTGRRISTAILCVSLFACATAHAAVDSWSSFLGGSWQTSNSWSLGVPPTSSQSTVYLTNQFLSGTSKTITIDATTAANFPSTMTVSNLVVLGASAIGGSPPLGQNILFLNNTGSAAFTAISSLTVGNDGVFFMTNSILHSGNEIINGLGSFFQTSGTNNATSFVAVGEGSSNSAALWLTGGQLSTPVMAVNGAGLLVQSNGVLSSSSQKVLGDWLQAGGVNETGVLIISNSTSATAVMSGGQLIATNNLTDGLQIVRGVMTISNGLVNLSSVAIANTFDQDGTLTVAGGSLSFGSLQISTPENAGTVWMTGGNLAVTGLLTVANSSAPGPIEIIPSSGILVQSNGNLSARMEIIGDSGSNTPLADGTLTIAGGTHWIGAGGMQVGVFAFGTVWLTGGQLIVTNGSTLMGDQGDGEMDISNGIWMARDVLVGGSFSEGTLTFLGGNSTILSNLNLGNCAAGSLGSCRVSGGSLFVTNAAHNAVLNVRNSDFLITGGHLVVDTLVMTNDCGLFIHAGGTVSVSNLLLDPDLDADGDGLPNGWEIAHGLDPLDSIGINGADGDPDGDGYSNMQEYLAGSDPHNAASTPANLTASFAFTSIVRSGNNIVLTWDTIGGTTNQVQVSPGSVNGSYSTNAFTNLGAQMFISGSGAVITNFTDSNGATNKSARYYRIRLVP